jgi:hypothetical protein
VFKPSIEFYVDRGMGLCVVTTTKDGRQRTAQYLREGQPVEWLAEWLGEVRADSQED